MNIRTVITRAAVALLLAGCAMPMLAQEEEIYLPPKGKEIYIPEDLKNNDFSKESSTWSYARMAYTKDVVVFWEKPFGRMLSKAPDLEGHNMKVDINNLLAQLQRFYDIYKNQMNFILPGSNADKYRMMVMVNYSLEGTAYGGDYDGKIGAMWVAPNRVQDKKLNCIAHELGHSFQSQIMCDGQGEAWGGGGIFEMTSQWMLWQVNPLWTTDENYHWKGFIDNHHLRFLHGENIYHSPFVLEYWSDKRGLTVMADLFRAGKRGEDPAQTYMRLFNLSLDDMNNEMAECYSRLLTFDFKRLKDLRRYAPIELLTNVTEERKGKKTTYKPTIKRVPETWGFNVVPVNIGEKTKSIKVELNGLNTSDNATYKTVVVAVDKDKNVAYSETLTGAKAKTVQRVEQGKEYYVVVVGCPKNTYEPYIFNPYSQEKQKEETTYPYTLTVTEK